MGQRIRRVRGAVPATLLIGAWSLSTIAVGSAATRGGFASKARPDLAVSAVATPPPSLQPGAGFRATDATRNRGRSTARASRNRYYLSPDSKKDRADLPLGSRRVPRLKKGKASRGAALLRVPAGASAGSYLLLVCADSGGKVKEANERNNCRASRSRAQVGSPQGAGAGPAGSPAPDRDVAPPRLILDVESGDEIADGLMQIVDSKRGSSDPTYYASNHRMVVTEAGRVLVVHGRHASGVQLAWRDPAGNWQTQSRGEAADGAIIAGTGTGDWPASIALARDSTGSERAWVAFARVNATGARSVYLRRLSGLDDPAGPSIGPLVVVDPAPLGAFKVDLQFESVPGGPPRGVMVWQRKASDTVYEAVTAWFTDLDGDTPEIQAPTVIDSRSSSKLQATLVDGGGMRIAARRSSGKLVLYRHELDAPLGSWIRGGDLYSVSGWPAAVALDSGELLVAAETDTTNHVVKVERYSPAGEAVRVDLQLTGYSAPAIASDGVDAWLVMVRQSDGFVVSRRLTSLSGWDSMDRVEIGPESSGYRYPNVVSRVDGRLRLIVRGPSGGTTTSAVLAFQRAV